MTCNCNCAHIAQSVEHFLGKEEVTGSNPVMSSIDWVIGLLEWGSVRAVRVRAKRKKVSVRIEAENAATEVVRKK